MTVLEECGISDTEVSLLLRQGLHVTGNTTPFPDHLISRSSDFVVETMDAYTPPLTDAELNSYVNDPQCFCTDLLSNIDIFNTLCSVLIRASTRTRTLERVDVVAAALASLMIYQSALDNHYYKYDAQIEFDSTSRSPVGHHWLALQHLCRIAADKLSIRDGGQWAQSASLAALQSVSGNTASQEFHESCTTLGLRIAELCRNKKLPTTPRVADLRTAQPTLVRELRRFARRFRRTPQEFVDDSLRAAAAFTSQAARAPQPSPSKQVLADIESVLSADDQLSFSASLKALRLFSEVQQEEGFRFKGVLPGTTRRNVEAGVRWWALLRHAVGPADDGIQDSLRGRVMQQLELGLDSGIRGLLALVPESLNGECQTRYQGETKRWRVV